MKPKQKQLIKELYKEALYTKKELIKEAFPEVFVKKYEDVSGFDEIFSNIIYAFSPEMFELPETGWVKYITGAMIFRTAKKCGYGIDACGDWQTFNNWSFVSEPYNWHPATREEVEEMLIKEGKRRGLLGCPIITVSGLLQKNPSYNNPFYLSDNRLFSEYGLVFDNGKWATPIEEEKTETIHLFGNMYKISLIN